MQGSDRPWKIPAKVSSDLEYLSSIPSGSAKSDKLSLEAQQVYTELQEISNKLKVTLEYYNHQYLPTSKLSDFVMYWNVATKVRGQTCSRFI